LITILVNFLPKVLINILLTAFETLAEIGRELIDKSVIGLVILIPSHLTSCEASFS